MTEYKVILSNVTYQKAASYLRDFVSELSVAGYYLQKSLPDNDISIISTEDFIDCNCLTNHRVAQQSLI